jgi:hypothetical protein
VRRADHAATAENRGAFEHVREFADVAGPCVPEEAIERIRAERRSAPTRARGDFDEQFRRELRGDRRDAREAGRRHREHREPVVEIFAESTRGDGRGQIDVRGREDTDVCLRRAVAADRLERSFLKDSKQLRLKIDR